MPFAYIVRCRDGSLYAGWTDNLEKRIAKHNSGRGAKYTRSRLPVELVWSREFETKHEAMSCEAKIKLMNREEKLKFIETVLT